MRQVPSNKGIVKSNIVLCEFSSFSLQPVSQVNCICVCLSRGDLVVVLEKQGLIFHMKGTDQAVESLGKNWVYDAIKVIKLAINSITEFRRINYIRKYII